MSLPPPANSYSVEEAAQLLDVSPRIVRQWAAMPPPSFFSGAFEDKQTGELRIPKTEVRRHLGRAIRPVFSIGTAAALLDVSHWTIRNWIKAGKIRRIYVCGQARITEAELARVTPDRSPA